MKNPKTMSGMMLITFVMLSGSAGLFGQKFEQAIGPDEGLALMKEKIWMAAELSHANPIKGAPYSAQAVKEIEQVLTDGNRIYRRTTSSIYRDSEGRTRQEQSPIGIAPFAAGDETLIFINDPVASVTYVLEPRSRTAHKSIIALAGQPGEPGRAGVAFYGVAGAAMASGGAVGAGVASGGHPAAGVARAHFKARSDFSSDNVRRESLGKQMVEGVEAEGTRTVITIPAGQIGNERAIEIVSERWYSDELAAVIMSRELDPRSGEIRYRLTNLSRAEPARSLFEVPSDYTIGDAGSHGDHFQMFVPPPPVKFAPKP